MKYLTTIKDKTYTVELLDGGRISVNGEIHDFKFVQVGDQPVFSLLLDDNSYEGLLYNDDGTWQVFLQGAMYAALVEDEREKRLRGQASASQSEDTDFHLVAPMPGLVVNLPVSEGQEIAKGDVLLVLESMKMQNELKSPRAGQISRVRVAEGDSVEKKQVLLSVT